LDITTLLLTDFSEPGAACHIGTGGLANFAFYAAVAKAHIQTRTYNVYNTPRDTQSCRKSTVAVTHVWVYAKDSYSFHDSGASSQYLGHWCKHGVNVPTGTDHIKANASLGRCSVRCASHVRWVGSPRAAVLQAKRTPDASRRSSENELFSARLMPPCNAGA
jgi:hypothetical protein